ASERRVVGDAFARWQALRAERDRLATVAREQGARAEYLAFQLAEIERAGARQREDDELTALRQALAHADRLQRLSAEAYDARYDGERAALPALGTVWRRLGDLAALDPRFQPYVEARDAVKSQLEDLAHVLRSYGSTIDASPGRLQEVEDRLAVL